MLQTPSSAVQAPVLQQRDSRHRRQRPARVRCATQLDAEHAGSSTTTTTLVEVSPWGRRRLTLAPGEDGRVAVTDTGAEPGGEGHSRGRLKAAVRDFALPRGFPASVTPDYLPFQLWGVPCHILGSVSGALATSSLLQAVGAGQGPLGTASAAAAIKWITKDGIGSAGRLLVGGRLARVFDEDPKHWRMVAEVFSALGLALDISTAFFPQSFLLLAGAGNFAKALGKGMTGPCFRSIQTHFARGRTNVGELQAKELVWEVTAHLVGLGLSVAALRAIEAGGRPSDAVLVWAAVQGAHAFVRYQSLAVLRFPSLNVKRAAALIQAHQAGTPLPGVEEANREERILLPAALVRPGVRFGASLDEAFPPDSGASPLSAPLSAAAPLLDASAASHPGLGEALQLYGGRGYLLAWRGGQGAAVLREGWSRRLLLRILWQAAWLEREGVQTASSEDHARSLEAVAARFGDFAAQAAAAGWDVDDNLFRHEETYVL